MNTLCCNIEFGFLRRWNSLHTYVDSHIVMLCELIYPFNCKSGRGQYLAFGAFVSKIPSQLWEHST